MYNHDDICAIATGSVQSAIAIVRMSGSKIAEKLTNILVFKNADISLSLCKQSRLYRAHIVFNEKWMDDVLISFFHAPKSYTGEDVVEIFCHGSLYIQQELLKILQHQGIRLAEPGEFSLRAYLNGKMDLTQAEAVNDIISSRDRASHQIAVQQMKGNIASEIKKIRMELVGLLTYVELELDFSEEDVEFASRIKIREMLTQLINRIQRLSLSFEYGNAIKNGVSVAIVGETNVGKSTLMNALLQDERSIVSSIPGTTRDIIEDYFTFNGVTFRFADTAGIRISNDEIEKIGVERARQKASQARIILLLMDAGEESNQIIQNFNVWKNTLQPQQQLYLLLNKCDKVSEMVLSGKIQLLNKALNTEVLSISAKYKKNLSGLMDRMYACVQQLNVSGSEYIISNARQYNALIEAQQSAQQALQALDNQLSNDLLAEDLKMVNEKLAVVTGEVLSTEVLNEIFSKFCIGK
jgi:tRNA modification GTPase